MKRAVFVVLWSSVAFAADSRKATTIEVDLDGEGTQERIVFDTGNVKTVSVLRGKRKLWTGVPNSWKPWKLRVANLDGKGNKSIVLGVHKTTRFFPKAHNCLFVFGWDGHRAFPKWLGSSLSKPFIDFMFADVDGDGIDELISIETTKDNRHCVVCYSWNGFGFTGNWQRGAWKSVRVISARRGRVIIKANDKRITLRGEAT